MNKCYLYGNVGKDPEIRNFQDNNKVAKFSLATSSFYKGKDGEKVQETQWHNITFWNKPAEIVEKYVRKGSSVIVEGEIKYRTYEDKAGNTKYFTEIVGNAIHLVGKKEEDKPVEKKSTAMSDVSELPGAEDDPSYDPFV
jgi:single-strand DNA-binding protein